MYLNLDLLYNVNNYLFPLFYYRDDYGNFKIYSPMTKKSVYEIEFCNVYFDYITKKYEYLVKIFDFDDTGYIFTENTLNKGGYIYNKCKSFKLTKEDLHFLKSNTRIN